MTELEQALTRLGRELDYPGPPRSRRASGRGSNSPLRADAAGSSLPPASGAPLRSPWWGCSYSLPASSRRCRRSATPCSSSSASRARPSSAASGCLRRPSSNRCASASGPRSSSHERPRLHAARARRPGRAGRRLRGRGIPGGELALAYPPGTGLPEARTTGLGLLVTEFRGDLVPELIGKLAGGAHRGRVADARRRAGGLDRGGRALLLLPPPRWPDERARPAPRRERVAARAGRHARAPRGRLRLRSSEADRGVAALVSRERRSGTAYQSTRNISATAAATIVTVVLL